MGMPRLISRGERVVEQLAGVQHVEIRRQPRGASTWPAILCTARATAPGPSVGLRVDEDQGRAPPPARERPAPAGRSSDPKTTPTRRIDGRARRQRARSVSLRRRQARPPETTPGGTVKRQRRYHPRRRGADTHVDGALPRSPPRRRCLLSVVRSEDRVAVVERDAPGRHAGSDSLKLLGDLLVGGHAPGRLTTNDVAARDAAAAFLRAAPPDAPAPTDEQRGERHDHAERVSVPIDPLEIRRLLPVHGQLALLVDEARAGSPPSSHRWSAPCLPS